MSYTGGLAELDRRPKDLDTMTTLAADPRMHGQDGTLQGMSVLPFDRANGGTQSVVL